MTTICSILLLLLKIKIVRPLYDFFLLYDDDLYVVTLKSKLYVPFPLLFLPQRTFPFISFYMLEEENLFCVGGEASFWRGERPRRVCVALGLLACANLAP